MQQPHPTWSEQSSLAWWQALEHAVTELRASATDAWRQVRAIGLSGQMHGAVVLDGAGQVLRPAILWNDGRSGAECVALEAAVPNSRQITGNLAMPGFTAPKLLWLRTHERALFAQIRQVLLPKDWLGLQLTGEAVSEMSDASGPLWLDVAQRQWNPTMLAACGLDVSHMLRQPMVALRRRRACHCQPVTPFCLIRRSGPYWLARYARFRALYPASYAIS